MSPASVDKKSFNPHQLGKSLMEVAHSSETAYAVAGYFHERFFNGDKQGRNRPFVDIRRTRMEMAREGKKVIEPEYNKYWKDLQALGVGSIIYGRKGKPDRFALHYSLKGLAKAMMDGTLDQETSDRIEASVTRSKPSQAKAVKAKVEAKVEKKGKMLYIPNLRKDLDLEISLPSDITRAEIAVIRNALNRIAT